TKSIISTALSVCSFFKAFSSSSSNTTNLSFAYSYAFTISSSFTSSSQTGHVFLYLIGDWHFLCNCLSRISLFSFAACILTGILTSPNLIFPSTLYALHQLLFGSSFHELSVFYPEKR